MADAPYTKRRNYQYRGPQSSEDYNARVEENYKDLVYLYNKYNNISSDLSKGFAVFLKELLALARGFSDFETRLQVLEAGAATLGFYSEDQIDTARFDSTTFAIPEVDRCTYQSMYGVLTLPRLEGSSISKVKFVSQDGTYTIPASLEMNVISDGTSIDGPSATIDTASPYNALTGKPGRIWDRNIIVSSPSSSGARCYLYVKVPDDLSIVPNTNALMLNVFPLKSTDLLAIDYTTSTYPKLDNTETWTPLNETGRYDGEFDAIGDLPPGGWDGDEIYDAGAKLFYFDPKPITAFRIKLQQKNYYTESGSYVYSYGLSKLDVRYDKFLSTGKTIIRFDAPGSSTISSIEDILPKIWNMPLYMLSDIFSVRTIWETSYDSGIYTLTPVPFSQRVWLEVTLNQSPSGGTPALTGLEISYR